MRLEKNKMIEFDGKQDEKTFKKLNVDLRLKQLQLNSLLQITEAINQNFSKNQLLSIYEFVLRNQLKIESLLVFLFDTEWEIALEYGFGKSVDKNAIIELISTQKDITKLLVADEKLNLLFQDIIPVYHKDKPLAFIFIGNSKIKNSNYKEDIAPFLRIITNIVAVALENKKLAKDSIKQAGIKKELALAAEMQGMLFPSKLPHLDNIEMTAVYLPHQEIGGDYYDFIRVNEFEFITVMADVSGKGVAAALLMSNFQATLHALKKHCTSLVDLVEQLNKSIIRSAKGEKFITLFICKFNTQTREFQYINAGHNPPLLFFDKKVHLLEDGTIGLGMFEKLPFIRQGTLYAKEGAEYILACYTDGIVELENNNGNHFGMERLERFIRQNSQQLTANGLQNKLLETLHEFKEDRPFVDDIALLLCKCRF
jgi:sigma-B regulation protein RsbU (phosphoserine phosphatase)